MPGQTVRIYRWEQAPNELRRAVIADLRRLGPWTHLALVPAHRRAEWDTPPVRWTDVGRTLLASGDLIVTGNESRPERRVGRRAS